MLTHNGLLVQFNPKWLCVHVDTSVKVARARLVDAF